ncbi:hypothetical protein NLM33_18850 [Bradyrhizobium sp. CCGUVB1N3]|uniref:hypothetical protein n=1 Tax=Bradyrhizobium sp. CCGUVB1N3 TaxID=2949629 RepID=UPI0020B3383D|nr:hypothetical protein [Bradyrhizobium sp. CCGUVB1N3]MCP3471438.1 hypothetical protein [Bradyrhizobium sp. CCGUVB1N3]MCP3472378.1 hypothetical protein [Bradyrhizobium sp. CCGUVB1N3]
MTTVNISTESDADFRRAFVYQTVDGAPIDLTGWTFHMMLRPHVEDATVSMELTTENGRIALVDAVNGKFELVVLQADLEQLAAHEYQQSLIASNSGAQIRIWRGTWAHSMGPSR